MVSGCACISPCLSSQKALRQRQQHLFPLLLIPPPPLPHAGGGGEEDIGPVRPQPFIFCYSRAVSRSVENELLIATRGGDRVLFAFRFIPRRPGRQPSGRPFALVSGNEGLRN